MTAKRKIGLMGGTFDPIHMGHIALAEEAKRQFGLEEVIFMPTGDPWHKAGKNVTPAVHRSAMVLAAIEEYPEYIFSDMEIQRKKSTYTAETLTQLCDENPDCEYYYIVGADSLAYMERWYQPEVIFSKAVILAACRNTQTKEQFFEKMEWLKEVYRGDIRFLKVEDIPISSSKIRDMIKNGEDISLWVPEHVATYINEKGLYR